MPPQNLLHESLMKPCHLQAIAGKQAHLRFCLCFQCQIASILTLHEAQLFLRILVCLCNAASSAQQGHEQQLSEVVETLLYTHKVWLQQLPTQLVHH